MRPGYLEVIGSVACIWGEDTKRQFSYEGITWLSNRHMRIKYLWVRDVVNDNTAMKIATIGAHLLWLDINENLKYSGTCSRIREFPKGIK
jgi:hypothetical protein